MTNRSDKKPSWFQLKITSDWLLVRNIDSHMISYYAKTAVIISKLKMKLKPKQLHRSLALPPNKDAPSKHQCSWRTGTDCSPSLSLDPKTGQFLDPQNKGVFSIFCAFWRNFLRYFPLAFCYGCCILTCLLVETGAGLVLVARQ